MLKEENNKNLYESKEIVEKYSANNTRARSLNNADKFFIDRFDVKNKRVLVLGCGAGRVPVNLLIFGNQVVGVDRSEALLNFAITTFPKSKFADLDFILADMCDLSVIPNESFDVVMFPMNSIDYIEDILIREKAIKEASLKIKKGGILALSSHSKLAYMISHKLPLKNKSLRYMSKDYIFDKEKVVGGGKFFKGNSNFIVNQVKKLENFDFIGFTVDARNKLERFLSRKLKIAQFIFPYIIYVFRKK